MRVSMDLSASSVRAARERIQRYTTDLPGKVDELCRRLAEIGMQSAVTALHDTNTHETGELESSIQVERLGERNYLVVTYCGYAVYVEFGTGVVGAGVPYPGNRPEYITGPLSRTTKAREDGSWVYWDDRQGRFRITKGQRPAGFLAAATVEMGQRVKEVAREVFGVD